jgi:hypothetical protein
MRTRLSRFVWSGVGVINHVAMAALRIVDRTRRGWLSAGLACAALTWVVAVWMPRPVVAVPGVVRQKSPAHALSGVPVALAAVASGVIGGQAHGFGISRRFGVLVASGGGVSSSFTRAGVRLRTAEGVARLSLLDVGYGARLASVSGVAPVAAGSSVSYEHGWVRQWYRSGPFGLEQGFTLTRRPAEPRLGPLTLASRVSGSLVARREGPGIVFAAADGRPVLRYGGLSVRDATGRSLPADMELDGDRVTLRVWDRGARYPLTVDPLLYQNKLTAPDTGSRSQIGGNAELGDSVALSADGSTALIGGFHDHDYRGAAWVFIRKGTTWIDEQKLTATGRGKEIGHAQFGGSVALSSDGSTALIGGLNDNNAHGAAWVFIRKGKTWTEQHKLTGTGWFGSSVALSSDGSTALIGGPNPNGAQGAAWVYARKGTKWTQESKLAPATKGVAEQIGGNAEFGYSVALSADGKTALVGGPYDNRFALENAAFGEQFNGAAWVFIRKGRTWIDQQKIAGPLPAYNQPLGSEFGWSVALSSDGTTALIGAPTGLQVSGSGIIVGTGEAWAYYRSFSGFPRDWVFLTELMPPTGGPEAESVGFGAVGEYDSEFGWSVALSSDGKTALVGGPYDGPYDNGRCSSFICSVTSGVGAAWVYSDWHLKQKLIAPTTPPGTETGYSSLGFSGALCSDGNEALLGGPFAGASSPGNGAWVFGAPGGSCVRAAPGAPTGVIAAAGNSTATVGFSAPPSNGSPITRYTVTASPGSAHANGKGSPITVNGLKNGTAYTFRVTATNTVGTGPRSKPSNRVTPAPDPGAPTEVTATAGNGKATVAFTAPASRWSPIAFYTVTASPGGARATSTAGSPITITGLTNGTTYTFTVTATNGIGTGPPSKPSNAVTPVGVPGAPAAVIVIAGDGQATVGFIAPPANGSPITRYTATASPGRAQATSTTGSPITITGLTNGTTYTFTVTATNEAGTGPPSAPSIPVTPATVPGAPTAVSATAGDGQATVNFTAPPSNGSAITGYTVTASPGGATAPGSGSPITVTGLKHGTVYTFTVTATNGVGTGPPSAPSNPVTTQ